MWEVFVEHSVRYALEFIVEFLLEASAGGAARIVNASRAHPPRRFPAFAVALYIVVAILCGWGSVVVFPHFVLQSQTARVLYLLFAPVGIALLMSMRGRRLHEKGKPSVQLDKFWPSYFFALSYAVTRYWIIA